MKLCPSAEIQIPGSKSESNRLLILQSLYDRPFRIHNLSEAEDTQLMKKALESVSDEINIHHAGTAMRFLTAYFSINQGRKILLSGSHRMKQRPIGILVDALNALGTEISYTEKEGFPPLKIKGKKIKKNEISLESGVSSQFVSALLLIAPKLSNGLKINLKGEITSLPYIKMTIDILKKSGVEVEFEPRSIQVFHAPRLTARDWEVESDFSSASYFYSVAALAQNPKISIGNFKPKSLQGDSAVIELYRKLFGVESEFIGNHIRLTKNTDFIPKSFEINLNDTPDLAQTIAVTAAGLQLKCQLNGLQTLKIKETDRLYALQNELQKIGVSAEITSNSISLTNFSETDKIPLIKTYNDHRMAMSFAPLCLLRELKIENPEVVNKSYPGFWQDFENCFLDGFDF